MGTNILEYSTAFRRATVNQLRNLAVEAAARAKPKASLRALGRRLPNLGAAERRLNSCVICALLPDSLNRCSAAQDKCFVRNPTLAKLALGLALSAAPQLGDL